MSESGVSPQTVAVPTEQQATKDEPVISNSPAVVNPAKSIVSQNGKSSPDYENDDDYEVEYVYEDEEEEEDGEQPTGNSEETAIEVVNPDDDPIPGQPIVVYDDDEEEVEVYDEEDELEAAEYDRIANRIDELLQKTNNLKSNAPEPAEVIQPEIVKAEQAPIVQSSPETAAAATVDTSSTKPTEDLLEEANPESDQKPVQNKSPPIERSSTVEETSPLSPPGQLRHMQNQWNISDLNDEENLSLAKDLPDSDTEVEAEQVAATQTTLSSGGTLAVPNLDAIREEDAESDRSVSPAPRPLDRLAQSLGEAMEDEEEVNEIEIALEDWNEGDNLEQLEEVEYEDDDNDEVDEHMPDNLLLHANDQIEQIDLPLTPSPTPSSSSASLCGGLRRPISPSSLILTKMRTAVLSGQLEPLQALIDGTPNFFIDAILKAGWTALMYASYRGYPEIVDFCLKRGADCNYHKEFFTSLMAVCSSGNTNEGQLLYCMDLLLEHGARVNGAIDKFGCSPLHYAARFGRALLTKCLCEHGAHINHANRNGWTALHWAAAENHGQVIATLLDQNADVHLMTKDGVTASQLAEIRKNYEIADALQEIERSEQTPEEATTPAAPAPILTNAPQEAKAESPVPVEPVQQKQSSPVSEVPASPVIPPPMERKFSDAEIEARKDEAREIVMNAIESALARDLSRLGSLRTSATPSPPPTEPSVAELRKRAMAADQFSEEEDDSGGMVNIPRTGLLAQTEPTSNGASNFVMSLVLAAILFILIKIMFYFKS